jgi:hypothetical protein
MISSQRATSRIPSMNVTSCSRNIKIASLKPQASRFLARHGHAGNAEILFN